MDCHFLLQCMKVKSEKEVAQSCPTLSDPVDCSLPGSSVHGIFQARVLEWGAIAFVAAGTIRPSGGAVDKAGRVELSAEVDDSRRVELSPPFVEGDPHNDAWEEIERVEHLLELGFVVRDGFRSA